MHYHRFVAAVRISPINTPPTHYQKTESDTSEAEEDGGKTREYFPESWIWTILKAKYVIIVNPLVC